MNTVLKETKSKKIPEKQVAKIFRDFSKHINKGQITYLKAGHLDMLETDRSGIYFTDAITGNTMIDCFASVGSFNTGRRNPVVLQALREAIDFLDMGTYCLASRQKIELGDELVRLMPGDLNKVIFTAGGGDGIDCAIKLARGATGRTEVISAIKAYHGHVGFALSAIGKEHYRSYCEPLIPDFIQVPFNDLEAMAKAASAKTAAIIIEPIQGEGGIYVAENEYLRGLRSICDKYGIILIFDEVQTGFGRTGRMFACEHSGVIPDIMVVAKSISGGMFPNAAVLYRDIRPLAGFIDKHPDFHITYPGGSDIGCYVSLRVIRYIVESDLPGNAERMGRLLMDALENIKKENPKIVKEVRGLGLMIGIEYIHEFLGPMMSEALAQNGVFAVYSANAQQVMRFMLPLVVTEEEINQVIGAIKKSVETMQGMLPFALTIAKVPFLLKILNNEEVLVAIYSRLRVIEDFFKKIFLIFR